VNAIWGFWAHEMVVYGPPETPIFLQNGNADSRSYEKRRLGSPPRRPKQ
jgi:hypothetical protein